MKSVIFAAVAALTAFTATADGSYLYWMVELDPTAESAYAFEYATVRLVGGTPLANKTTGGTELGTKLYNNKESGLGLATEDVYAYNFAAGSTFLFELFDSEGDRVAWKYVAYTSLQSYIGSTMNPVASPYVLSGVVPEPAGGVLWLVGLAALALRRRRV